MRKYIEDIRILKNFHSELKKCKPITKEEEIRLWKKYRYEGDMKARDAILVSNYRFVYQWAERYKDRGVPLSDLLQCGILGVLKGLDRFDGRLGIRPMSYAVWWLREEMQEEIRKRKAAEGEDMPLQVGEGDEINDDFIPTGTIETNPLACWEFDDYLTKDRKLKEMVKEMLSRLSPSQRNVLELYFGIGKEDEKRMTLEEVAEIRHSSKQAVHQLYQRGLAKLGKMMEQGI